MSKVKTSLAIEGGRPVRTEPVPVETRFDGNELKYLEKVLAQNTLFYNNGSFVKRMLEEFKAITDVTAAAATTSGTAAIHVALGAAGVKPGEEVITAPITDIGTIIPILYQNAVPVFADLNPHTYNIDPESVGEKITRHTRAVIAVHLTGNPCDLDALKEICSRKGVALIEDCAQAWGARYDGRHVGVHGDFAAFSLNDFKHISVGDGGIAASRNEETQPLLAKWADKFYDRINKTSDSEHLSPNYRMSELCGAVGLAQLEKLDSIVRRRNRAGTRLTEAISGIRGIMPPAVTPKGFHSYWFYLIRINEEILGPREEFCRALQAEGVPVLPGYVEKPVYRKRLFMDKNFFNGGQWPAEIIRGKNFDYPEGLCPVAEKIISDCVFIPLKESFTDEIIDDFAEAIEKVAQHFARG